MQYLKRESSLIILDRYANLKYKYGNRQFWYRGYYVDRVDRNKKAVFCVYKNQLQEDMVEDQLDLKELIVPL